MTQVNLRLRAWAWLARRIASVAARSEADVIALQARRVPDIAVTRWLFGAVPPGVEVTSQLVPGPAGDIPRRREPARHPRGGARAVTDLPSILVPLDQE